MSDSRRRILDHLRSTRSVSAIPLDPPIRRVPMVPRQGRTEAELWSLFITKAQAVGCGVHVEADDSSAVERVLSLIDESGTVMSWSFAHIPLAGLALALKKQGIEIVGAKDAAAIVGLTGADAALSATGSLVLEAGPGKQRGASLLPPKHIAILRQSGRILPDLESWIDYKRELGASAFQQLSSAMVITGPSRTADIAMESILGMHGPGEVHVVIIGALDQPSIP